MVWDFDQVAHVLNAVGLAAASDESLDVEQLAQELDTSTGVAYELLRYVDRGTGLAWVDPGDEPEFPPRITRAGSQYLSRKGDVPGEVLSFLPSVIDDLNARQAMINAGVVLVDEFRLELAQGKGAGYAANLVPDAFAEAVDDRLAVSMFAALVALLARLSCGRAAGCLAEEIMAVALIEQATVWLDMEADKGELDADDLDPAREALRGIFELFEDDDVLDLFEMEEPADAALAGHSWINRQAGVADQRIEAWFQPFGGVPGTGHLNERRPAPGGSST